MAQATYWIGQNGNIYYGSGMEGAPVQDLGSATKGQFEARGDGLYDRFTDNGTPTLTYAAQQIQDPSAVQQSAPSGGGGTTSTRPVLDQAAVNNTQATIDQIPSLLAAALAAEQANYNNTINSFNAQEQSQRGQYDQSTTTNTKNYDANMMDSVRSGAKGLGGLMQILRGTGAEGWARDTVGTQTSKDIRTGLDTRDQNQTSVDAALSSFLTELKGKKQVNEDAYENNRRAVQRESDTQLQDLFGKMAGYYGEAEMAPQRQDFMNRAGALTPSIAQNSMSKVSAYDNAPVSVKAPDISAFAAPTNPNIGYSASGGQVGSGIFTMARPETRRRERDQNAVPMGA